MSRECENPANEPHVVVNAAHDGFSQQLRFVWIELSPNDSLNACKCPITMPRILRPLSANKTGKQNTCDASLPLFFFLCKMQKTCWTSTQQKLLLAAAKCILSGRYCHVMDAAAEGASTRQSCTKILLKIIKGIIVRPKSLASSWNCAKNSQLHCEKWVWEKVKESRLSLSLSLSEQKM